MGISNLLNHVTQTQAVNEYVKKNTDEFVFVDDKKIEELHRCYLSMLKDLNEFCEKTNIKYILIGGSLLGKIRHNGFIPWDDDFDIAMSREDVEKLKRVFYDSNLCKKYDLRGPGCKEGAEVRITKIYKKDSEWIPVYHKSDAMNKVFIDIFIIEYVPENSIKKFFRGITCDLLIGIIGCVEYKVNPSENNKKMSETHKLQHCLRTIVGSIFSVSSVQKWYDRFNSACYYKKKTNNCTIPTGKLFYFGETVPSDYFYPYKETEFCGIKTWIPNNSEKYLSNRYGDFMKIPSESERETHYVKKLDVGIIDE